MLKDVIRFFRQERLYFLLFVFVILVFILFSMMAKNEGGNASSAALNQFRQSEDRLQQAIEQAGSLQKFLNQRPALDLIFQFLSFLGWDFCFCSISIALLSVKSLFHLHQ